MLLGKLCVAALLIAVFAFIVWEIKKDEEDYNDPS